MVWLLVITSVGGSTAEAAGAAGNLTAQPSAVDFGNTRVGTPGFESTESIADYKTTVTLSNSGDGPITIGSITGEGGDALVFWGFTGVEPGTYQNNPAFDCLKAADGTTSRTLAPGATCVMFVSAYPTSPGPKSTTMTVRDPGGAVLLGVRLALTATEGYHVARARGAVLGFGDAVHHGDVAGAPLRGPLVGVEQVPFREGYWLAASDGGVFSFGRAEFYGSPGGLPLNAPVVGMAAVQNSSSGDRQGYYLVGRDGGVFNYGPNANFSGSMAGSALNAPMVDMAADFGQGYRLAGEDGGVFAFDRSAYFGSMAGRRLNAPIVAIVNAPRGGGYWLVGADGGVFAFGDAPFAGSLAGVPLRAPIVDMVASPTNHGYWMLGKDGSVFALGDAPHLGDRPGTSDAVGISGTAPSVGPPSGGIFTSLNQQAAAPPAVPVSPDPGVVP